MFFPFKCCVSQLSVDRFGKNFEGVMTLGQVNSSPNFYSFGPQRAEKCNIWRRKNTNLNFNSWHRSLPYERFKGAVSEGGKGALAPFPLTLQPIRPTINLSLFVRPSEQRRRESLNSSHRPTSAYKISIAMRVSVIHYSAYRMLWLSPNDTFVCMFHQFR